MAYSIIGRLLLIAATVAVERIVQEVFDDLTGGEEDG